MAYLLLSSRASGCQHAGTCQLTRQELSHGFSSAPGKLVSVQMALQSCPYTVAHFQLLLSPFELAMLCSSYEVNGGCKCAACVFVACSPTSQPCSPELMLACNLEAKTSLRNVLQVVCMPSQCQPQLLKLVLSSPSIFPNASTPPLCSPFHVVLL